MEPTRKIRAGPMTPSSMKTARKSFAVTNTYVKPNAPQKEIITVHTSTPHVEKKSFHAEQNQVYQGDVNVLSIMYKLEADNMKLQQTTCRRLVHTLLVSMDLYEIQSIVSDTKLSYKYIETSSVAACDTFAAASCCPLPTCTLTKFLGNKTNERIFGSDTSKDIMCCKYTEDVNDLAAGFTDGTIRLFDCSTGDCTHTLVDDECRAYPGPVTAIKHRPVSKAHPITNMLLSSYVNGCIKCWKYKYDQCLYTIREKRQTLGLCYHPQYTKFITYGDDAKINMYDEEAQTQERAFYSSQRKNIVDGHTSRIFSCAFNPKSHHELISGGWDNTVMCWDDRQPYATRYFFGVHMCGEGLDFDKPGKQILTCSWQDKDSIQLWDYGSCKLIKTIVPDSHQSKLYCGKLVPRTNLIVCGGSDSNILRVVDINMQITECSIRNNPGGIYAFDFGTIRRKPRKVPETYKKISEIDSTPRVAFVTGKRLQTVDFG